LHAEIHSRAGIWDPYTARLAEAHDPEEMIVWRKEVEDLIGLEEYCRIESETVER